MSIAGHMIVWSRLMSLPMTCRSAGHHFAKLGVVGEAGAGDVVDERVEPDVDGAGLGIPGAVLALGRLAVLGDRERDPPRRVLAADREVLEAAGHEAEHLVLAVLGLDPVGMLGVVALERRLVLREAEEPVALGQPLQRDGGVVRAVGAGRVLDELALGDEPLVRAVPALVRAEVEVALGVGPPDELVDGPLVVRIGRPDEPVGRDAERVLGRPEQLDHLVDEGLGRLALLLGRHRDVHRVLVGAGEEARVVAAHPVPAGEDVRGDDLVQRVQAGPVVRVGDRGREVVASAVGHGPRS